MLWGFDGQRAWDRSVQGGSWAPLPAVSLVSPSAALPLSRLLFHWTRSGINHEKTTSPGREGALAGHSPAIQPGINSVPAPPHHAPVLCLPDSQGLTAVSALWGIQVHYLSRTPPPTRAFSMQLRVSHHKVWELNSGSTSPRIPTSVQHRKNQTACSIINELLTCLSAKHGFLPPPPTGLQTISVQYSYCHQIKTP